MAKNNLLIIGNGFDLTCKLKSSYTDYFNSKFTKEFSESLDRLIQLFNDFYIKFSEQEKDYISVYLEGKNEKTSYDVPDDVNIWDLIIYYGKKTLPDKWSDVESRILEFLIYDPETYGEKNIPNFNQMKDFDYTIDKIYNDKGFSSYFYSQLIVFVAAKFDLPNPSDSKEVLLSELKNFEANFIDYLSGLFDTNGIYYYNENAEELLNEILSQANSKGLVSHSVLSFNYTTPFSSSELSNMSLHWQNIHGRLRDRNIIFGVDQEKVKVTDVSYQFTKTYRQLLQDNFGQNQSKTILPSRANIEKIIFYGHSLSEADYSYFQSIFDYYDIYGSTIEITFFYHDYKPDQKKSIQQNHVLSVSNLIKRYGQTMGNKDHGDNLLHKLIIEKRLSIKKLKVPTMLG